MTLLEKLADPETAGEAMKEIRINAGLSCRELADLMYYRDVAGLRQMERGKRQISGPIRFILEMIESGVIDPEDYLVETVGW